MTGLADDSAGPEMQPDDLERRKFLGKAGRFAAVTPPAMTLLLGTSLGSRAIAGSAGTPHHPGGRGRIARADPRPHHPRPHHPGPHHPS